MRAMLGALAVLGVACVLAGCGGGSEAEETGSRSTVAETASSQIGETAEAPVAGGVYRIGVEEGFNFSNAFDPTGEYNFEAWGLYSSLLVRTLIGYRHVAGVEGSELVPDLAEAVPEVSEDGLSWTFTLKEGVRFGPPVSREVTSADVEYAFERIGTPALGAQYGFYYDVIEGMAEFREGAAKTISGIETPDARTITFRLTEPTGDFGYRLALPAAGPIPGEVAGCFDEAGEYGRYLVATGPYMIEGSDAVDATSCKTLEPPAGFDPETSLSLVRNPDYDPATDDPSARQSLPDGFLLTVNANAGDIFAKIEAGELEGEWATPPPKVLKRYSEDPDLADRLQVNDADSTAYITMNLTQPPFDDVHVRRAANFVMDKAALQLAWGGALTGEIATHVFPNAMLGDLLVDYDPFPSPDFTGDVDAAKAEMAQSAYDSDGDGMCDADACAAVLNVSVPADTPKKLAVVVEQSLAEIGIELQTRELADPFPILQNVSRGVPTTHIMTWGKDYADPSTFAVLFDGRQIIPRGNVNLALVGLTPETAEKVGASGTVTGIPSVDADIDGCTSLTGEERLDCWASLDRRLTEEVVPWVPYLSRANVDVIGPAVTEYAFDQFPTVVGYAHVAVDPAKQVSAG